MVNIPMKSATPLTKQTLTSINQARVQGARSANDILSINSGVPLNTSAPSTPSVAPAPAKPTPQLLHTIQKGQKVPLGSGQVAKIKASLGWNTTNSQCDVDVSAFMLSSNGKVVGDSWFVFYGQTQSPDGSTIFSIDSGADRESITIDFTKLNSTVNKIVFVLTINEALEKNLNFSMIQDAYIRIMDASNNNELVSFQMSEYYSNVTSMMIGEVYLHNGGWKFNAIGNGVARDLAGLCELYGVEVV